MKRSLKWWTAIAGVCAVVAGIAVATWWHRCPEDSFFGSVGTHASEDAATRAAIRELSAQLHRCPDRLQYRLGWEIRTDGVLVSRSWLLYSDGTIGREDDPMSGFTEIWGAADVAVIHAVAKSGGDLKDLARLAKWERPG